MNRLFLSLSVMTGLLLSACSSYQQRITASGSYDYLQEPQAAHLVVPDGLDSPNFNRAYELPPLGENAPTHTVGQALHIMSPALVLPVVSGSHLEEGSKQAMIFFDQIDDSQPLDTSIWNSLLSYLEQQGIGVFSFDKAQQRLVTDWLLIEEEVDSSWYSWTSTERQIGKRFEFKLKVKPHGRSASLQVTLVDYMESIGDKMVATLDQPQQRRDEIDILNKVIDHYAYQIKLADSKRIRLIRQGLASKLGFDPDGHPAFVVDADYDVVWPRLLLVLRSLGFNVKDLDKSNGLLFVKYAGSEQSWWSSLWGDDEELQLAKEEYRMQVSAVGKTATITMMDNDNQPFTAAKISDLFDTFAKVMAEDDLDI